MGKSGTELKHVDSSTDLSGVRSASIRRCVISQRLQVQIVRSHADAKLLMQRLDFVVVVVLSI
jgi:hypothetical protein